MSRKKQRLELTWIGKDKRPRLEPRILLEDHEKSYHAKERITENDIFDNKLIFGDNLLALKALEAEYTGKVKCIYIDPPFNTGAAFDNYDDGLEHSVWLSLMKERLSILNVLLRDDGILFVHIDDKEQAYLRIILDETFGRSNFLNMMVVKTSDPSGHKTVNPSPYSQTEYVYMYAKNRQKYQYETIYVPTDYDSGYNRYITNIDSNYSNWETVPINDHVAKINGHKGIKEAKKKIGKLDFESLVGKFALENCNSVYQATAISNAAGRGIVEVREESKKHPNKVFYYPRDGYEDIYVLNGRQIYFYSNKVKKIDGSKVTTKPLTNMWIDIPWNGIANEGDVQFKNGKKPEKLLRRCIELGSEIGDIVLDSFAGSGTTAAVAHKMGRKWIAVELGEQCHTHIIPRMRRVIDGQDQTGITKNADWKGGGGFRYYRLALSMLEKDKWGNWVISKDYNAGMLAAAMCKHMGFTYAPDESHYWIHGRSTEADFIYVTTIALNHEQLRAISEEVGPGRTLLICCKAFNANVETLDNLTLKKIPKSVLEKCEWGRDDYSLNVARLAPAADDQVEPDLFEQAGTVK